MQITSYSSQKQSFTALEAVEATQLMPLCCMATKQNEGRISETSIIC